MFNVNFNIYKDILHIFLNGEIEKTPYRYHKIFYPKGLFFIKTIANIVANIIVNSVFGLFTMDTSSNCVLKNNLWFFTCSKNNYDALKDVVEKIDPSIFVWNRQNIIKNNEARTFLNIDYHRLKYIWKLPIIVFLLYKEGVGFAKNIVIALRVVGVFEAYIEILNKLTPKGIVFANDHSIEPRALLLAAKSLYIPTIYIQHANVNENFPPIRFDLSLLEGEDSLYKYKKCTKNTFVYKFIGMPKFDKHVLKRKKNIKFNTMGIALNALDSFDKVLSFVKLIKKIFPNLSIIIRLHPADDRDGTVFKKKYVLSDPKKTSVFKYLNEIDINIAAETSLHLEATMLNVPSIYYNFTEKEEKDVYGFQKNGLTFKATKNLDVIQLLEEIFQRKEDVYKRAKYYNAFIGTDKEGKSAIIAKVYILDFIHHGV